MNTRQDRAEILHQIATLERCVKAAQDAAGARAVPMWKISEVGEVSQKDYEIARLKDCLRRLK